MRPMGFAGKATLAVTSAAINDKVLSLIRK